MKRAVARTAAVVAVALVVALTASACGSSDPQPTISATASPRVGWYHVYLESRVALLIRAIQALYAEVKDGDYARAGSRWARARVRYAEVEPASERFPGLNARIDGEADDARPGKLTGFRLIERTISTMTTAGLVPVAKQLLEDARALQTRIESARFGAQQLADSSNRILSEILDSKFTPTYDSYFGLNLLDVAANLEAVEAAFKALRPLFANDNPMRRQIARRLTKTFKEMYHYGFAAKEPDQPHARSPGTSFTIFHELSPGEVDRVRLPIEALAGSFAELRAQIAAAR